MQQKRDFKEPNWEEREREIDRERCVRPPITHVYKRKGNMQNVGKRLEGEGPTGNMGVSE